MLNSEFKERSNGITHWKITKENSIPCCIAFQTVEKLRLEAGTEWVRQFKVQRIVGNVDGCPTEKNSAFLSCCFCFTWILDNRRWCPATEDGSSCNGERERERDRLAYLRLTAAACDGTSLGADVKEAVDGGNVAWGWWERLRLQGEGERARERVSLKYRPTF